MGLSAEAPAPSATAFDEDEGPDRLAGTPLAAPRRVGLSRATHAVLVLGASLLAAPVILALGAFVGEAGYLRIGPSLAIPLLTAFWAHRTLRRAQRAPRVRSVVSWAMLGACLEAASVAALFALTDPDLASPLVAAVFAGLFGGLLLAPVALPIGAVFGGLFVAVLAWERRLGRRPPRDATARWLAVTGAWCTVVAGLGAALVGLATAWAPHEYARGPRPEVVVGLQLMLLLLLAVAATLSALSLARGRAAARLVEEIAAGQHAGLRLRRRGESWGVVAEDGAGPFRAAERDLGAVPRRHRRRRWALALFAMQLGLFIAVLELGA